MLTCLPHLLLPRQTLIKAPPLRQHLQRCVIFIPLLTIWKALIFFYFFSICYSSGTRLYYSARLFSQCQLMSVGGWYIRTKKNHISASHHVLYFSHIEHLKVVWNENRIHRKGKCTQNIDNGWKMFFTDDRLEKNCRNEGWDDELQEENEHRSNIRINETRTCLSMNPSSFCLSFCRSIQ